MIRRARYRCKWAGIEGTDGIQFRVGSISIVGLKADMVDW